MPPEGAYASAGMPALKEWIGPGEVDAIRAFVVVQRNKIARK